MKRREGGRNITEKNIQGQHQSHLGADSGHGDQLLVLGFLYILTLIHGTLKKKRSQRFVYKRLRYFIFLYFHRSAFCVTLCKPCAQ